MFTSVPYRGNPLAVVADAEGLSTEEMQRFASWTNFSETTFLLAPTPANADQTDPSDRTDQGDQTNQASETGTADYRVRIFTPDRELPFAGHPTLGSCRVWLDQGGVPRRPGVIVQECGAGLVTIRSGHNSGSSAGSPTNGPGSPASSNNSRLAFAAPPLVRSGPVSAEDLVLACEILGIDPGTPGALDSPVVDSNWVDNGPPWMAVLLRSADDVLDLRPASSNPHGLFIGVVGPHPPGSAAHGTLTIADAADSAEPAESAESADGIDFEVRGFFPLRGALAEDPVTGSLNASLGQWLTAAGHATAPYTASQGAALGRDGRVYIDQDPDDTIWVGGEVVTCIQGTIEI